MLSFLSHVKSWYLVLDKCSVEITWKEEGRLPPGASVLASVTRVGGHFRIAPDPSMEISGQDCSPCGLEEVKQFLKKESP